MNKISRWRKKIKRKKSRWLKIQLLFNYTEEFLSSDFVLQTGTAGGHVLLWESLHLSQQHVMFPHEFVWPQQPIKSHETFCLHQMQDVGPMDAATTLQPYSSRGLGLTRRKTPHLVPLPGCRACGIGQLLSFQRCSKGRWHPHSALKPCSVWEKLGKHFLALHPALLMRN